MCKTKLIKKLVKSRKTGTGQKKTGKVGKIGLGKKIERTQKTRIAVIIVTSMSVLRFQRSIRAMPLTDANSAGCTGDHLTS